MTLGQDTVRLLLLELPVGRGSRPLGPGLFLSVGSDQEWCPFLKACCRWLNSSSRGLGKEEESSWDLRKEESYWGWVWEPGDLSTFTMLVEASH